jgi:putative flippase GtrA
MQETSLEKRGGVPAGGGTELRGQMGRFLVAGICAVATDTGVYFLLVSGFGRDIDVSKVVSFLAGTVVAFVINKFWTFESPKKSLKEAAAFLGLYLFTMALNAGVNHAALAWIWNQKAFAFVLATGASTVTNFAGQKWVVFRK